MCAQRLAGSGSLGGGTPKNIGGCRGCEGYLRGFDWLLKPMTEMGVRCMTFEGSQADPRDYTPSQVHGRMEVFMESLGLSRLDT